MAKPALLLTLLSYTAARRVAREVDSLAASAGVPDKDAMKMGDRGGHPATPGMLRRRAHAVRRGLAQDSMKMGSLASFAASHSPEASFARSDKLLHPRKSLSMLMLPRPPASSFSLPGSGLHVQRNPVLPVLRRPQVSRASVQAKAKGSQKKAKHKEKEKGEETEKETSAKGSHTREEEKDSVLETGTDQISKGSKKNNFIALDPGFDVQEEMAKRMDRAFEDVRYGFVRPSADTKKQNICVTQYTARQLKQYPDIEIHIGSDSQNRGDNTVYCTAVAYRYPGHRGVDYVILRQTVPRVYDFWTRLWGEIELSIKVADWLSSKCDGMNPVIDMDYNQDSKYKSNLLVAAAEGWAQSLGYRVSVKPALQIATFAADIHC